MMVSQNNITSRTDWEDERPTSVEKSMTTPAGKAHDDGDDLRMKSTDKIWISINAGINMQKAIHWLTRFFFEAFFFFYLTPCYFLKHLFCSCTCYMIFLWCFVALSSIFYAAASILPIIYFSFSTFRYGNNKQLVTSFNMAFAEHHSPQTARISLIFHHICLPSEFLYSKLITIINYQMNYHSLGHNLQLN